MSATGENIENVDPMPLPATEGENFNAKRLTTEEIAAINARIAELIASPPTVSLARQNPGHDNSTSSSQNKNQGQDIQQRQIYSNPEQNNKAKKAQGTKLETFLNIIKNLFRTAGSRIERLFLPAASIAVQDSRQKETEKDPNQNKKTGKAQGTQLETFFKINKDLLSTAGSPIERLFLHAASIAIFPILLVRSRVKSAIENSGRTKTDGNRANRQNFRAKTQTQAANIKVKINVINVHQPPLSALNSVIASRKIGWNSEGMGTAQTGGLTVRVRLGR